MVSGLIVPFMPLLSPHVVVSIPLPGHTPELIPQVLRLGCRTHWALLTWTRCAPGAALLFWSRGSQQPPPLHSRPPASTRLLPVGLLPAVGMPCCTPPSWPLCSWRHSCMASPPAWCVLQLGEAVHSFLLAQQPPTPAAQCWLR